MLAAAVTGLADYSDTDGTALTRATAPRDADGRRARRPHRVAGAPGRGPRRPHGPIALSIIGFLIVTAGAFVGGDVVYVLGNMVSRHAFRGAGTKWIRLDPGAVADLAALPEATPTKVKAGINDLVVVRIGDTIHALHDVCAHAGGPLHEGTVVDGCIECPWHGLALPPRRTGAPSRGPTVYDQPAYEVRAAEAGGYEVRRRVIG